eukprot:6953441-Prymnesium_polylepis.1
MTTLRDAVPAAVLTQHTTVLVLIWQWLCSLVHWLLGANLVSAAAKQAPEPPPPPPIVPVPPEDGQPAVSLLEYTSKEFAEVVERRLGRGGQLARALYADYHSDGVVAARAAGVRAAA